MFMRLWMMKSDRDTFKQKIDSLVLFIDSKSISQFIKKWESQILGKSDQIYSF